MTDQDWNAISEDEQVFPGPRGFFLSGYDPDQIEIIRAFLDGLGYDNAPLTPCAKEHLDLTLTEALTARFDTPLLGQGKLPYVLVMSGVALRDVKNVLDHFSSNGLPRPIFATTTETNLDFTIKQLLRHLLDEQRAVREATSTRE